MHHQRREFLVVVGGLGFGGLSTSLQAQNDVKSGEPEAKISAPEDLMREHGVLNRVLLIYEEVVARLTRQEDLPPEVIRAPARLVRRFVEDYHEHLEERFIFPPFDKAQKHVELVSVLREQHLAGRKLTDRVLRATSDEFFRAPESRQSLIRDCGAFMRMYRPHEAREDTVLFPSLYEIMAADRIKELGEQFEEEEHRLFGEEGFQRTVEDVATIEKQLGIFELAQFTPVVRNAN